ncbi:MAG: hypothetical protein IT515_13575 [Burkholderiales bacterium]|nr:hypothetical protein [Burkholderiales bacterium]
MSLTTSASTSAPESSRRLPKLAGSMRIGSCNAYRHSHEFVAKASSAGTVSAIVRSAVAGAATSAVGTARAVDPPSPGLAGTSLLHDAQCCARSAG